MLGQSELDSSTISRHIPYKRTGKACLNCRRRKSRCEFDKEENPCKRCREYQLPCTVPEFHRRGGYANVKAGREKIQDGAENNVQKSGAVTTFLSRSEVLTNEVYNANDAIEILNRASFKPGRDVSREMNLTASSRFALPAIGSASADTAEKAPPIWFSSVCLEGVLTAKETFDVVSFFFAEAAPFYSPFIPSEYADMKRLAKETVLFAVICLIGARRYNLEEFWDLHARLWDHCRKILGQMMLDCPDSQVRSLIYAVVLLAEWYPGVFLQPSEVAGDALRRHTRICWPILAHVTRLARYTGILDHDMPAKLAVYYTDHLIACRLGQRSMLDQTSDIEKEFPARALSDCSRDSAARANLLKLFHLVNHTLYRSRGETNELVKRGHHLNILRSIHPMVERWKLDYNEIFQSRLWADRATIFEFCHFELYLYAVVLLKWQSSRVENLLVLEETRFFLELAIGAAKYIVLHESSEDRPVQLDNSPIGWITRLLHAAVFLSKTLLVSPVYRTADEQKTVFGILRKAANIMAVLPPEDHYMYSKPINSMLDKFEQQTVVAENAVGAAEQHPSDPLISSTTYQQTSGDDNGNIWDMLFNDEVFRAFDNPDTVM